MLFCRIYPSWADARDNIYQQLSYGRTFSPRGCTLARCLPVRMTSTCARTHPRKLPKSHRPTVYQRPRRPIAEPVGTRVIGVTIAASPWRPTRQPAPPSVVSLLLLLAGNYGFSCLVCGQNFLRSDTSIACLSSASLKPVSEPVAVVCPAHCSP